MNGKSRILVFGNYDGTNIGDDCILLHVLNEFEKDANDIIIPSRRSVYIAEKYHVNSIQFCSFKFVSEFFKSNVFLIGGGGIFSRYIGPCAKFLPLFAMFAKLFGKKVIYYKVGVYNTAPFLVKELVKLSMLCSDEISVRDSVSFYTLGFVSRLKNVTITLDPGLALKPVDKSVAKRLLLYEKFVGEKILVGLSLKYTIDKEMNSKIVSEFSKFIDWIIEKFDAEVAFFPFSFNTKRTVENDLEIAKEIQKVLKSKNMMRFKVIQASNYTPNEIKGMVGLVDLFIGMRFHSILFAYSMKKPLIGVSYEEKCRDFLESKRLPFIDVEHVEFSAIKQLFLSKIMKDKKIEE